MNTGQMLLTMCGMFLLSMVIVRTNNTFLSTGDVMYNTKFGVLATSLGTSMIEEASSKAFDESTFDNSQKTLDSLTYKANLGPEYGEVYPNFNDIDDYNGYTRVDTTMPAATFTIKCQVGYIQTDNPNVILTSTTARTWHKKIVVTVTSPSMKDKIQMSSVYSYWFFR